MDEDTQLKVNTDFEFEANANLTDVIECEVVKEKVYIPRYSYKKFLKPLYAYITLGIIIIILLIIILGKPGEKKLSRNHYNEINEHSHDTELKNAANKSRELLQYISYELIINDNNNLWGYDPKSEKSVLLQKGENFVNVFDIYREKMIFWSEENVHKIFSTSSEEWNASPKNISIVFEEIRFNPQALAVDFMSKKLYAVDKSSGTLIVIDIQTKQYSILSTTLTNPHDIVLDPLQNFIFILQRRHSILRLNMDGTDKRKIVFPANVTSIALDRKNQRIYWIDDFVEIKSSTYTGYSSIVILKNLVNIISLTYFDKQLFWLWSDNNLNDTSLWSCIIVDERCTSHYVHPITFSNASLIKAFSHTQEIVQNARNPCMRRNGGCQQLCLLTSHENAGRSCACYLGWQLKSDLTSCQLGNEFIIHIRNNTVRLFHEDIMKTELANAIFPTRLSIKPLIYKDSSEFAYDAYNDYFYFSDDVHIYKMNLKQPSNQTIIYNLTGDYYINDIAFDWISKNLFYIKCSVLPGSTHSIMIYNTERHNSSHRVLSSLQYSEYLYLNGCPRFFTVNSKKGYLFYEVRTSDHESIYQVNLNSTVQIQHSMDGVIRCSNALAIDSEENRLYCIYCQYGGGYCSINYNNIPLDHFYTSFSIYQKYNTINAMYVYQQWLYLSSESNIWRISKTSSGGTYSKLDNVLSFDV